MQDPVTARRLGSVIAVTGPRVEGMLDQPLADEPESPQPQFGSLVKIESSQGHAYGIVSGLTISEPSSPLSPKDRRLVQIDLLGESLTASGDGGFARGVSIHPALGAAIHSATTRDLAQVYAKPKASCVAVGNLHQDPSLPAYVITDELIGKHFAILGTSGTGKSCAVAVILRAVLAAHPCGHVVLLDPHQEYATAFGEAAELVTQDSLELPYWLLNFEELSQVLLSQDSEQREAEASILKEAVIRGKRQFTTQGGTRAEEGGLTVDTPVPYRLTSVLEAISQAMGQLGKPTGAGPYLRLLARIEELMRDRRYAFMFSGMVVHDSMASVLSRLLRIPVGGKPITIVSLSGVPSEIVDVVVSLLCRIIFEYAVWSPAEVRVPVLVVCEEAHRYAPRDPSLGFAPTRRAIARIAKEGRKYGVALGLVTQRPSEVSQTILSQCNTLFALRMSNDADQQFVRHALPDTAAGLLGALPALRTQEAVVVGEGVTLPMRIHFADLAPEHRPHSASAPFSRAWQAEEQNRAAVEGVIDRWRRQIRR